MFELKPIVKSLLIAFGSTAASALLMAGSVSAQQQDQQQAQKLERVEVTGTNIKRSDVETAAPVTIITREEIARSGKQNIAEVVQTVSANNQGSIPASFTSGFAAGSAGISLRGLGVNATLVLVNGRRMAPYGLADDGQRTFVDLNAIPLEAVERVEVLKDGASAIYGSDAIGGVVNIILRKDFQGAIAGASYGQTKYDDGKTTRAFGTFGFGNLAKDRYNVNFTLEGSKEEKIRQADRPGYLGTYDLRPWGLWDNRRGTGPTGGTLGGGGFFSDGTSFYNRSIPEGVVLNPAPGSGFTNPIQLTNPTRANCEVSALTGLCIFDHIVYADVQPETTRANLAGRATFQINAQVQAYADFGYFTSEVKGGTTPTGTGGAVVFDPRSLTDPANFGPLVRQNAILPAGHPDNPTGVNRAVRILMTDLGGRRETIKNDVLRLIGGVTGEAWGWNYDTGVGYLESKLNDTREGYLRFSAFQNALNTGSYRINNPSANNQAVYDAISPKLVTDAKNSVTFVDGKISRELLELAGGPLGIALGAEWREEKTDSPPVPFTDVADIWGLGFAAFNSKRNVYALYGEVAAPVTKALELSAAIRYDHYSDYGNSTTPKVGFKFQPLDQLTLRGTYAESFRAPGPAENGNSSSAGYTGTIILVTVGNPAVKPEEAKSATLGLIFEPWQGGSASLDYYRIKRTNEIVQADQAAILAGITCPGGGFGGLIPGAQPSSQVYCDAGRVLGAIGLYQNANSTKTEGYDLDARQRFNLGSAGRLTADVRWTHIRKFERTLADGTKFEYAGTHGPFVLSAAGGTPQNRGTLTLNLDRGPWAFTWAANYVGRMEMIDHKGETLVDNGDGSFSTSTAESSSNGPVTGVCGVYAANPVGFLSGTTPVVMPASPYNNCKLPSFTWHDVTVKYSGIKNLDIFGSILNVFNTMAPLDPYTYGGVNYNPTFHQAGAVGRFYSVGFRYKFF